MSDRPAPDDRTPPDEPAPLPDGVVPLGEGGLREAPRAPGGCGLTGCLYGMVALFVALLAVVIYVALTREWTRPVMMP